MKLALPLIFSVAVLSGCASNPHSCEMPEACSPVRSNYEAAIADPSPDGWLAGDKQSSASQPSKADDDSSGSGWGFSKWFSSDEDEPSRALKSAQEEDAVAAPVYIPAKPHRVWLAPWLDQQGQLRSGSYLYFTTPARWRYLGQEYPADSGSSTLAGQSSKFGMPPARIIEPVAPDNYGFQPVPSVAPQGVLPEMTQPTQ